MNIDYKIEYLGDDENYAGYRTPNVSSTCTDVIGMVKRKANGSPDAIKPNGTQNKRKITDGNISIIRTSEGKYLVVGGEKDGHEPDIGKENKWLDKYHNIPLSSNIEVGGTLWIHNVRRDQIVLAKENNTPLFLEPGRHVYNTNLFEVMEGEPKKADEPVIQHENLTRIHVPNQQLGVVNDGEKYKLCKSGKTYTSSSPYFRVVGFLPLDKQYVRAKEEKDAVVVKSKDEMELKINYTLDFNVVKEKAGTTVKALGDVQDLGKELHAFVRERLEKWFRDLLDQTDMRDFEDNNDKTIKQFFKEQLEGTDEFKTFEDETGIKVESLAILDISVKDIKAEREAEAKKKEEAEKLEEVKKAEAEMKAAEIRAEGIRLETEAKRAAFEQQMEQRRQLAEFEEAQQQKQFEKQLEFVKKVTSQCNGDAQLAQVMLGFLSQSGQTAQQQRGFGGQPFSVFGNGKNSGGKNAGGFNPQYMGMDQQKK